MNQELCSVCIRNPSNHELFNFFDQIETESEDLLIGNLWDLVNPELSDPVNSGKICEACLQLLKNSYDFKVQCLRASEELKGFEFVVQKVEEEAQGESVFIYEEVGEDFAELIENTDLIKEEVLEPYEELQEIPVYEQDPELYFCSICGASQKSRKLLYQHEKRHNKSLDPAEFHCDVCSKPFNNKSTLKQHILNHLTTVEMKCDQCEKVFNSKSAFQSHQRNVHESDNSGTCGVCGKFFKHKTSLIKHQLIHSDTRNFPCTVCPKSFRLKHHLEQHLRMHSGERIFDCKKCGASFSHYGSLNSHMKAHISKEQGIVFPCPFPSCNRSYTRKKILDVHLKSHTLEAKYNCEWCPAKYHQKSDIKSHIFSKHLNYLKFSCELCEAKLKLNERFHKTYSSHIQESHKELDKEAMQQFLEKIKKLKVHEMAENLPEVFQDNPFRNNECSVCGLNFSSQKILDDHRRTCV
jgi:hypothetical protein